jgi:hypothetical protein
MHHQTYGEIFNTESRRWFVEDRSVNPWILAGEWALNLRKTWQADRYSTITSGIR